MLASLASILGKRSSALRASLVEIVFFKKKVLLASLASLLGKLSSALRTSLTEIVFFFLKRSWNARFARIDIRFGVRS